MMDDHYIISAARNHLADALKILLNPDIMTTNDFEASKIAAIAAIQELEKLCSATLVAPGPSEI